MEHVIYKDGEEVKAFSASSEEVERFVKTIDQEDILYHNGKESVNTKDVKDWDVILKHFTKRWSSSKKLI